MIRKDIKANILLLSAAIIWGFAFTAQRFGMQHLGPFTFNALRFFLGSFSLVPLVIFYFHKKEKSILYYLKGKKFLIPILVGSALFLGSSLQQIGIQFTTAGNAGFITGLYVIIVPLMGIFLHHKTGLGTWIGASLAVVGMYLLSVHGTNGFAWGDFLVFVGAFFWAIHVILVDKYIKQYSAILLACLQFFVCGSFSLIAALILEDFIWEEIQAATIPLLYAGIMSVGVAFTLQVIAQRHAKPAHTAIILSLESVFAAIGGWILLSESLGLKGIIGAGLMLTGMLISQLMPGKK
jgi:drug/metabolite transporter (DMT)-like permease